MVDDELHDTPSDLTVALRRTRTTLEGTNARLDRLDRSSGRQRGVIALLVVLLCAVTWVGYKQFSAQSAESRQRCEDGVGGRQELREAIAGRPGHLDTDPGVIGIIVNQARDPQALAPLQAEVIAYLEEKYGPPPCAAREGIDVPGPTGSTPTTVPESPPASPVPAPTTTTGGNP